jgi:hypothetical protein
MKKVFQICFCRKVKLNVTTISGQHEQDDAGRVQHFARNQSEQRCQDFYAGLSNVVKISRVKEKSRDIGAAYKLPKVKILKY